MAKQHQIRWKKDDYKELQKAVKNFNRKIDRLEKKELNFLPDRYNYKDLKNTITTRNELNRFIKSLKRFTQYGDPKTATLESGELITKWELRELKLGRRRAIRRLENELKEYQTPENKAIRPYTTQREDDIKAQIKNLQKLETFKKGELKRLKNRIKNIGSSDYEMRKAIIFRENYLNNMKKYENFDNYDKLMEKLKSIKNPLAFFDYVSQNEITQDLTYQSDQYYTQREFDKFIEDFGIDLNGDEFFGEIEEL